MHSIANNGAPEWHCSVIANTLRVSKYNCAMSLSYDCLRPKPVDPARSLRSKLEKWEHLPDNSMIGRELPDYTPFVVLGPEDTKRAHNAFDKLSRGAKNVDDVLDLIDAF